ESSARYTCYVMAFFFFSSRRRHTRSKRDWSSDVCSSDLSRAASAKGTASPADLKAEQRRIEHHLLRVQQERFEARNRKDPPGKLKRLEKEFQRTQKRRLGVIRDLAER